MARKVKPENRNKPATPKQTFLLFQKTKLRWKGTPVSKGEASDIIDAIMNERWTEARVLVRRYFPDFEWETKPKKPLEKIKEKEPQEEETPILDEIEEIAEELEPEPEPEPEEVETETPPQTTKRLDEILGLLNEGLVKDIKTEIQTIAEGIAETFKKKETEIPDPTDIEYIKPKIWDKVYSLMKSNNVLLFGPAGCGKTLMCRELAKAQNTPFYSLSCAGGMRYSQLIGKTELVVEDGMQVTRFVPSRFLEVIQEPGVSLLDEVFAIDPDALQGLNGILDYGTRGIRCPDGTFITVHPEHKIIAAANTNGRSVSRKYTAPQAQDLSVLSRFLSFKMDYDKSVEGKLLAGSGLDDKQKIALGDALTNIRGAIKTHQIPVDLGTRDLTSAIRALKAYPDTKTAIETAFLGKFSDAERAKVENMI